MAHEEKTRANPQIWRLAEYIWNNFYHPDYEYESWELEEASNRNRYYDKAKKLLYMIQYNAFVGKDDHND